MKKKAIAFILISVTMLLLASIMVFAGPGAGASCHDGDGCDTANDGQPACSGNNIGTCSCDYESSTCLSCDVVSTTPCPYGCSSSPFPHCLPCQAAANCAGKTCGSDQCGGFCSPNNCPLSGKECYLGTCCAPVCDAGQKCGSDHCGGQACGTCNIAGGERCYQEKCCTPHCTGIQCQDDGCGGTCMIPCADPNRACNPVTHACDIVVSCTPVCPSGYCDHSDGCGGTCHCGTDAMGQPLNCVNHQCILGGIAPCSCFDNDCAYPDQVCSAANAFQGEKFNCVGPMGNADHVCVDCTYMKGELCQGYFDCNPDDRDLSGIGRNCATVTNYTCIDNHCCEQDEMWDVSTGRCVKILCSGSSLPDPPPVLYPCANTHTGGQALCNGACGVACFHGWDGSSWGSESCKADEQCIKYSVTIAQEGVKWCNNCVKNLAACCVSGMASTSDADCKACNANWYLSKSTHCCQKGYEWDSLSGTCIGHEPCYALSSPGFCNSLAPNSPAPQSTWWNNPFTSPIGCITDTRQGCCYNGTGLYGYLLGDQFYYWHNREKNIVVY
jgi:hypothetical protein